MRLAILSSYTTDFLRDRLKSSLAEKIGKTEVYQNPFNQHVQDILNKKSAFYNFSPEFVIFLFDEETWIKNQNQLIKLIRIAKRRLSETTFFIGNIAPYKSTILPSLQWNAKNSKAEQISACNLKLAKLCQTHKHLYIVDINELIQFHGRAKMFDKRLEYLTKSPWSEKGINILSDRFTQQIMAVLGKRKKVIALDLDNTLWGGVLGEDGVENLVLSNDGIGKSYYDFQQSLLKLYESGILLVICSKNDEYQVFEAMEKHPYMLIKKHHLAAWRINWNTKVNNLISIAEELNLGIDSFILLDDSAYERKLIKFALPEVETPELPNDPSEYSEILANISSLDTIIITEEDSKRNEMYQNEQIRNSQKFSSSSVEKFLKSLHIQVSIRKATSFTIPRISQLTQKTNQFNLTGRRYTETQITQLNKDTNNFILTISSKDTIGDMGLVGVVIAKKIDHSLFLDTFLMSCRVLGRGIEETALFSLTKYCDEAGCLSLLGEFISTKKNNMAKDFYIKNHFTPQKDGLFVYNIRDESIKKPSWVTLKYD